MNGKIEAVDEIKTGSSFLMLRICEHEDGEIEFGRDAFKHIDKDEPIRDLWRDLWL